MKRRSFLSYYLLVVLFLFPLFFFPLFRDPFVLGKNLFLIFSALLGLVIWALTLWQNPETKLKLCYLDGFFVLLSVYLTGYLFFLKTGNRYDALLSQPAVGSFWALTVLFFLLGQVFSKRDSKLLLKTLGFSAAIISLINVLLFVLPDSRFPLVLGKLITIGGPLWSPLGSTLESVWLLLPLLVYLITNLVLKVNREGELADWLSFVLSLVLLVGLAAGIYQLFQLSFPLLDQRTSWVIAAESFKRQPLFGVGPGRFAEAFTLFKPASFNLTDYWNFRFIRASGFYLQWWTELGLVGLGLLLWLVLGLGKKVKEKSLPLRLSWGVLFLLPLFLPSSLIFPFLLFFSLVTFAFCNLVLVCAIYLLC